jgi:predicted amidohydrolase
MISGIGFFQFVEDKWIDPIGSLEKQLREQRPARDSLIVLPEAFNFGADYKDNSPLPPRIPAREALAKIAQFSRCYGVVLVAGILIPENSASAARQRTAPYLETPGV